MPTPLRSRSFLALAALALAASGCAKEPLMPRSYAAEIQEALDPAKVELTAEGVGEEFDWAVHDAYKAAMARLVQDMVQSSEERRRFDTVAAEIYGQRVRYVQRWTLTQRRVAPDGDIHVKGEVVLNRRLLRQDLEDRGVIQERRELMRELSHPTVAVLSNDETAAKPFAEFAANHAASFLTQRKYDVLDLGQLRQVEAMAGQLKGVRGIPDDPQAVIALQAGADVYAVFDVQVDQAKVGRDATVKASASVKAYETTTARQIGAASGFSQNYAATAGAREKAVAEALADAFDRVLANVDDYWKDDLKQGHQFLVTVSGEYTGDAGQRARRAVYEAVRAVASEHKENLATGETLNYRLWYDGSNTDLLFALQDRIDDALPGYRLKEVTTNRKLLVLNLARQ